MDLRIRDHLVFGLSFLLSSLLSMLKLGGDRKLHSLAPFHSTGDFQMETKHDSPQANPVEPQIKQMPPGWRIEDWGLLWAILLQFRLVAAPDHSVEKDSYAQLTKD